MKLHNIDETPGLWPQLRHDERLSGHQPLAGAISEPSVTWSRYLGGPLFEGRLIEAEGGGADLLVPFGGCLHRFAVDGTLRWKSRACGIEAIVGVDDIDNDGRTEVVASNGKSIIVLDAHSGEVLWTQYLGPPDAGGFMHTAARLHRFAGFGGGMQLSVGLLSAKEVALFDFTTGSRTPTRRPDLWMDDFFHPSIVAADLDGDGRDELVVTKLSSVYAFDPLTGRSTAECWWSSGGTPKRNYGLLEAVDVDGDGSLDLVVISDRVSRHIAVIGNNGSGELSNRWDRFVEHIYDSDECELRFVASSVVDIDGDGRPEIVVSVFNERGDDRWHLEVIDAQSGATRLDVPDAYVRGVDRSSSDPQVYVSIETQRVPGTRAPIVALSWREGSLRERWSREDAAFVGRFAADEPARALFRTDLPPADDVLLVSLDGATVVATMSAAGLTLIHPDGSGASEVPDTHDVVSVIACGDMDGDGRDELVVSNMRGAVTFIRSDGSSLGAIAAGARLRPGTGAYYMAKPMAAPVVCADAKGRYCAVPDAGTDVHVFEWSPTTAQPVRLARFPMRGRIGPEEAYHAVSWCRIDDQLVVLGSDIGETSAALIAVDPDGHEHARIGVPGLPASPPVPAARTGIHDYILTDLDEGPQLVVSGFRSPSMNSEHTSALDASGSVAWTLDGIRMPGHVLGPAPWSAASISRESGTVRMHFLAKDTLCSIDVASGSHSVPPLQLRAYNTAAMAALGLTVDDFSAYGSVIPCVLDGRTARLLDANYGGHGLITESGSAAWWRTAPLSSLTNGFGALADIDGDGQLEVCVSEPSGDLVCLDALSGEQKWRLHLGAVATGMATCDIDGCGRSEVVLSTREGALVAVGTDAGAHAIVKWRLDFGYTLGPPVIADFDGDGRCEILVASGDGSLYSVS